MQVYTLRKGISQEIYLNRRHTIIKQQITVYVKGFRRVCSKICQQFNGLFITKMAKETRVM